MDMPSEFVDQLSAEAGVPQPTSAAAFPTLEDFDEGATGALKWKDLTKDRVYQILTAQSINNHYGTSFVLSLQTADRFLLHCLGMLHFSKITITESQHAQRQKLAAINKTDWTKKA